LYRYNFFLIYCFIKISCFVGLQRQSGSLVETEVSVGFHLGMILPSTFCHRLMCSHTRPWFILSSQWV